MTPIEKCEALLTADAFLRLPVAAQEAYLARFRPPEMTTEQFLALPRGDREARLQQLDRYNSLHLAALAIRIRSQIAAGAIPFPKSPRLRRKYGLPLAAPGSPVLTGRRADSQGTGHVIAGSGIDSAIERARVREAERADRTPRRLWTASMEESVRHRNCNATKDK